MVTAIPCPVVAILNTALGQSIEQLFAPVPTITPAQTWQPEALLPLRELFERHHHELAGFIIEPIMQVLAACVSITPNGAAPGLCEECELLLIADEIATGFGRTGRWFACEHAAIEPDIMCLGKALTGGYMTQAAVLASAQVGSAISAGPAGGTFMHGPTFMGNPLACAVANASLSLLEEGNWQQQVNAIHTQLERELRPLADLTSVADVRCFGAIGVVEMQQPVDVAVVQQAFVEAGVWIRPWVLVYLMPPFIIQPEQLTKLTLPLASGSAGRETVIFASLGQRRHIDALLIGVYTEFKTYVLRNSCRCIGGKSLVNKPQSAVGYAPAVTQKQVFRSSIFMTVHALIYSPWSQ